MDTQTQINELKRQVEALTNTVNALKSSASIPYEIDSAFRDRFKIDSFMNLTSSTKSATSENQAVNEGGMATYSVLKAPDGFDQRTDGVTVKYYPYFT